MECQTVWGDFCGLGALQYRGLPCSTIPLHQCNALRGRRYIC
jgi:hypothetical protein